MHLTHLSLTNFRTFTRLDMDVPRRILLLVGNNAQGKTSLLEAIYYLATFTSLNAQTDRQLISFLVEDEPLSVARLVAAYHRDDQEHQMEVRLILDKSNGTARFRKEILLDGVKKTMHQALGSFNAVIFLPQMTRIIEGGPDERRRYLNLALAQAVPGYARALSEYTQVLSQRNALLKQLSDRSGDPDQLLYWDDLLCDRGAKLIHSRMNAISQFELQAAGIHQQLTNSKEVLRLQYQPSYNPFTPTNGQIMLPISANVRPQVINEQEIMEGFAKQLITIRREEIARGVTTIGPHRDEFRVLSNGIDLGHFGSRGQIRSSILALKLAEVAWLKDRTGHWPVLLLDEILAEFDTQRRENLLDTLHESDQCFLTTTDLNLFTPNFVEESTTWQVEQGTVQVQSLP